MLIKIELHYLYHLQVREIRALYGGPGGKGTCSRQHNASVRELGLNPNAFCLSISILPGIDGESRTRPAECTSGRRRPKNTLSNTSLERKRGSCLHPRSPMLAANHHCPNCLYKGPCGPSLCHQVVTKRFSSQLPNSWMCWTQSGQGSAIFFTTLS